MAQNRLTGSSVT